MWSPLRSVGKAAWTYSIASMLVVLACDESNEEAVEDAQPPIGGGNAATGVEAGDQDAASANVPDDVPAYVVEATAGEWTAIGVNTLADVVFDYDSAATPDGFRRNLQGIMDAWSGGTYARELHRLYVNGGGHRDYDGNEWYAFDVHAARWERVNDPSLYLDGSGIDGVFPDGAPGPIHTYDALVYAPSTNGLYRMGRAGSALRSVWEFGLDTRHWRDTGVGVGDPHSSSAKWDPATGTILLFENSAQASGYGEFVRFDPRTSTRTPTGASARIGAVTSALDATHGELVYTGGGIAPIRVDTTSYVATELVTSGDTALEAKGGPGFTYDVRRDRFTGWGAGSDTRTLYHLSRIDWSWTTETPSSGAVPGAPNVNGVFGRFQYVPEYDVMILTTTVSGPVMMYKPLDWSPPS